MKRITDWMRDWSTKINMKMVIFAKKMLKNPLFDVNIPILHQKHDKNYIIDDVRITGYSVKDKKIKGGTEDRGAVFCALDCGLLQLGKTYYPSPRFSIPKSHLESFETDELNYPQRLVITEWAFDNCYITSFNKIYEHWGRMIKGIYDRYNMRCWDYAPMYKFSPYRHIIEELHLQIIRDDIKNYKKKRGIFVDSKEKHKHNNIKGNDKTTLRKEAVYTFQVNGSANVASNKQFKPHGHYSVYLKNTEEKWKKKEEWITVNAAELKAIISAMYISIERGYKNVIIETDSNNSIQWYEGNWEAKTKHIIPLVEKMEEYKKKVPNMRLRKINRSINYAHAI
ncbi:hypothetical protein LCGC14_1497680 [marine sediment metagenome]|uniref:RNase H type-1 domain-containing protein n=1 Tax=marine sediment metagenome TaxID=412755 RepID=A0A0F9JQX3_9ZZZZ